MRRPLFPPTPPGFFGSASCWNNGRSMISMIEDVLGYWFHVRLALERGSGGWRRFRRALEHAGLRRLQQATVARRSPVNRANRLLPSYVAYCSADQHLGKKKEKKRNIKYE